MAPGREPDNRLYLISTPAGGKFLIGNSELSSILSKNAESVPYSGLYGLFAKKVGDNEAREHFIPISMCDISPYSEPIPETEPVGCATVEQPPERLDDRFGGEYQGGGFGY